MFSYCLLQNRIDRDIFEVVNGAERRTSVGVVPPSVNKGLKMGSVRDLGLVLFTLVLDSICLGCVELGKVTLVAEGGENKNIHRLGKSRDKENTKKRKGSVLIKSLRVLPDDAVRRQNKGETEITAVLPQGKKDGNVLTGTYSVATASRNDRSCELGRSEQMSISRAQTNRRLDTKSYRNAAHTTRRVDGHVCK